jgi:cytochrome o ubiquinol oxidase operon protein cyoD
MSTPPAADRRREIWTCVTGYGLALALTCAAFAAVRWQTFAASATLALVLGLALVQIVVHFRFFLRVNLSRSSRDNLWLILFSGLIIALMVSGTLVILFNMRQRMM